MAAVKDVPTTKNAASIMWSHCVYIVAGVCTPDCSY